ncbi:MAG: NfeD family protein [Candidatus Omnitrophota bacterium]
MNLVKKLLLIFFIFFILLSFSNKLLSSEQTIPTVYSIPVTGTIDLGLSSFIKRSIDEAKAQSADIVVLEIDTLGGRVDAADEIVMAVQALNVPTYAYISNTAWSAGALIALSCKKIIMKTGSSIGSAEPRTMGVGGGCGPESTDEKMISALRAKFKATAEANNHSVSLAEAMVDKDIEIVQISIKDNLLLMTRPEYEEKKQEYKVNKNEAPQVISQKGKLLNLTAKEALEIKLSSAIVDSEDEFWNYIKENLGKKIEEKLNIIHPSPNWSENLVRFLTHPIVSSLLLSLGFLGLIFELKMPGWGISGTLGALFIILFFWGHYLVGLASWVDIMVFVIGIALLLLEIFVIPGFGVTGVMGILFIFTGLILTLVKHPFTFPSFELQTAFNIVSYSFITSFIILILAFKFFPKTPLWKRIRLDARETKEMGFQTKTLPEQFSVGKIGKAKTMLRPAGRATFDDQVIDVITQGDFIKKDEPIKIVKIEGNKIFVEKIRRS